MILKKDGQQLATTLNKSLSSGFGPINDSKVDSDHVRARTHYLKKGDAVRLGSRGGKKEMKMGESNRRRSVRVSWACQIDTSKRGGRTTKDGR